MTIHSKTPVLESLFDKVEIKLEIFFDKAWNILDVQLIYSFTEKPATFPNNWYL